MNIKYTYEVVSINEAGRCMEVVYTSEGNPTMHIGTRLPYEGETVEAIVEMYAPVRYWEELKLPVLVPEIGASGIIVIQSPQEQPTAEPTLSLGQIPGSVL
jgi:hypothetical protein